MHLAGSCTRPAQAVEDTENVRWVSKDQVGRDPEPEPLPSLLGALPLGRRRCLHSLLACIHQVDGPHNPASHAAPSPRKALSHTAGQDRDVAEMSTSFW